MGVLGVGVVGKTFVDTIRDYFVGGGIFIFGGVDCLAVAMLGRSVGLAVGIVIYHFGWVFFLGVILKLKLNFIHVFKLQYLEF